MDKYRRLFSNTVIFGIGTFSSKVLVFLLMPLYTRVLSNADYGIADLIVQTSNLLLPLVSLGIVNAVLRFGLDRSSDQKAVFTTGLLTILGGFSVFLLIEPLLRHVKYISSNTSLILLFVLMSSLRSLCAQFVRSREMVRLFAIDGVLSTGTVILYNIIFLVVFRLGVAGYVFAIILSDFTSAAFLTITARLWRFVNFDCLNRSLSVSMLRYSIPLIPTSIFWWITNVSDRFIVSYLLGSKANGLYAVSYKVPTIVILISSIFIDAWQMTAVTEIGAPGRDSFFSRVFAVYQSAVFLTSSALIMLAKVITSVLVSPTFYPSWRYIPLLVMATSFSCFVTFLGSVYMAEKKSVLTLLTTLAGAAVNVILNILLIPVYGVNAAAFSTFAAFFAVFLLRAINSRRYVKIDFKPFRLGVNLCVIALQSILMIGEFNLYPLFEALLFSLMILVNGRELLAGVRKLTAKYVKK